MTENFDLESEIIHFDSRMEGVASGMFPNTGNKGVR